MFNISNIIVEDAVLTRQEKWSSTNHRTISFMWSNKMTKNQSLYIILLLLFYITFFIVNKSKSYLECFEYNFFLNQFFPSKNNNWIIERFTLKWDNGNEYNLCEIYSIKELVWNDTIERFTLKWYNWKIYFEMSTICVKI